MNYFENHGSGLHRLIYVSRSELADSGGAGAEIATICAESAVRNRARAVTGVLLAYDGWFIQALEGSYAVLKPLFDQIAADPRHTEVTLKIVEPATARLFGRWGMKQGRAPTDGGGLDVGGAEPAYLLKLLRLSALTTIRRAA